LAGEKGKPLRIKACPTERAEEQLLKIEVESDEDLEKLAAHLDVPIIECSRKGYDAVIDARDKILFYRKKEKG
jgi:hypothetical protein